MRKELYWRKGIKRWGECKKERTYVYSPQEKSNTSQKASQSPIVGSGNKVSVYNTYKYPNRAYPSVANSESATYSHSSPTCSDMSQTPGTGLSHTSVLQCEPSCGQETVPVSPSANASAVAQVSSLLVVSYLPAAAYADVAARVQCNYP